MKKIILKNGNIIDENGIVICGIDVLISDGKIEKLGKFDAQECVDKIDCTNLYITPGFVNLHTHAPMNIFKGIAEDVNIDDWFNVKIFPYESKITPHEVYLGACLACVEMINNGVTAFADHYFCQESVYKAVEEMGIRADIAPTIFGLSDDYKNQLSKAVDFVKSYKDKNSRIKLRLGPHAPYTCPGEILTEIIDAAKKLDVGIHIHVSETKEQVENSFKLTGKTPFEVIRDSGGFDTSIIVAHGLWVTDEELLYLNDKATFAFCPKTYMKLSMGNGRIYELKNKINYSFGTDGAASSNTLSPLEQARLFALNGKNISNRSESFDTIEIWKALMNGHSALNFNAGKIKEGCDADLNIWDLNMINTYPVYDAIAAIIYSSDSSNIKHTMVQGEFLKYDGKLKADVKSILDDVKQAQTDILERGTGKSKVNY